MTPVSRFDWEKLIRASNLESMTRLVAMVAASYSDKNGTNVRPGRKLLAAGCGTSKRTIERHLAILVRRGFLHCVESSGSVAGRAGAADVYQLTAPTPATRLSPGSDEENEPDPATPVSPGADDEADDEGPNQATHVTEPGDTGDRTRRHGCRPTNQDHEEHHSGPSDPPAVAVAADVHERLEAELDGRLYRTRGHGMDHDERQVFWGMVERRQPFQKIRNTILVTARTAAA